MLCIAHLPHNPAVWSSNAKVACEFVGELLGLQEAQKDRVCA
jgi:sorbitol-specific phosphotransferase system component IIBC